MEMRRTFSVLLLFLFFPGKVVVKSHRPVDHTILCQFDDPISDRIDKLMVMRGEQKITAKIDQPLFRAVIASKSR